MPYVLYNQGHGQNNVDQMGQRIERLMMAPKIKQELDDVHEVQEKRIRISSKVEWNQSAGYGPINVSNSSMPDNNRSVNQLQLMVPEPKFWTPNILSTLEANVKKLVEDCKSTCEALSIALRESNKKLAGHQLKIDELNIQLDALMLERNLSNLEINEAKETIAKAQNDMDELKTKLEAKFNQAYNELQENLEKKHDSDLAQLRVQHVINLENETEQFSTRIESLKKEHSDQVADMKIQIQAAIEAKHNIETELNKKYQQIVAGIKQTAESERTQLMEQAKGSTRCICCGELNKVEVFCNEQCTQIW